MKKLALHWKILIGLFLGVIWAVLSSFLGWSKFTIDWIAPFGTIFINLLKLIAVPLVLFSIIEGISGLSNVGKIGRMGAKTLFFYLATTVTAVGVGLFVVNTAQPGSFVDEEQRIDNRIEYELWASNNDNVEILDGTCLTCDDAMKDRVAAVAARGASAPANEDIAAKMSSARATKGQGPLQFIVDMVPSNIFLSLNNNSLMLQVIFFAIFFGITIITLPRDTTKPLRKFITSINEVFLKMVHLVMNAAPFFVFALLAGTVSRMAGDDPSKVVEIFKALSSYSIVLVIGLAFMVFAFYPLVMRFFIKGMTYVKFFKSLSPAQLLAFSTSSSVATLPVTMECVEENLKVPEETASFVLPIGATVNMDGTSLYQAVAVVFLAQFHMVDLTFSQQLVIVLTATLASIGSAAVPSAGLIMMILVLESVGLNPAWIGIIFPVDRILDMCRTVVNVTGDATVATLVANSEGELVAGDKTSESLATDNELTTIEHN
ncbi:dicarboxylate/amino acid:cation symporter [Fulvivirgaceae bacterium BMA12]|uniref:Dicarboxylate/amino acid:cation symporter n=1 Tax=Agaribacillus aureus TaxID=3051825 RepID=A0ABT8LHD7_9BACT|nr:dicarboxylate/amino acid:cation symporter [Fulvivirgaceae bacterium BMA12]